MHRNQLTCTQLSEVQSHNLFFLLDYGPLIRPVFLLVW